MTFITPDQSDAIRTLIEKSRESGATVETVDNVPGCIEVAIGPNHWLIGPNGGPVAAASNEAGEEPFDTAEARRAIRNIISASGRIRDLTFANVPLTLHERNAIFRDGHEVRSEIRNLARTINIEY